MQIRKRSLSKDISLGIQIFLHSTRPTSIKGRLYGPKVLINTVPKSGTNLIANTLWNFPYLRRSSKRTISTESVEYCYNIKKGEYCFSHLPFSKQLSELLINNGTRVLFIVRDPRDVVISRYKYITYIDLNHRAHNYFNKLSNDEERLMCAIIGKTKIIEPIDMVYNNYYPWKENENCLMIKFEDLIGSKGGSFDNNQIITINNIANFLNIPLNDTQIDHIAKSTFSEKSPTFNTGQIGKWRKYFSEEHTRVFKELNSNLLIKYEYEVNNKWK